MSREKGEYYGNPRNQFWRIICSALGASILSDDYEQRKALLFANGIAVWDVIAQCETNGALDSTIRNPVYNSDLPEFINKHRIRRILFNGNNAFIFYKRGIGNVNKNVLPSTSPAYAGMCFEEKLRLWLDALLN
jgi:hypoxanthine-DNA glycosylase